jgi:hypothetical protein
MQEAEPDRIRRKYPLYGGMPPLDLLSSMRERVEEVPAGRYGRGRTLARSAFVLWRALAGGSPLPQHDIPERGATGEITLGPTWPSASGPWSSRSVPLSYC